MLLGKVCDNMGGCTVYRQTISLFIRSESSIDLITEINKANNN